MQLRESNKEKVQQLMNSHQIKVDILLKVDNSSTNKKS